MSVIKKILFCLAVGFFLSQGIVASAAGVTGPLDAGGFSGQSFAWDYSFYVSGAVSATTDDPAHIVWSGLTATMNYPTAGDRTVNFTFQTSGGTTYSGTGRIKVVAKEEWAEKPRVGWYNYESDDFMSGNVDYAATVNSAKKLNINTISPYYFYGSDTSGYEALLSNLNSINHWPIIYATDMNQSPYRADFISWAGYFANLSLTHPNLQAMVIDDYDPSVNAAFTHNYAVQIMQAKNRVNPNFKILPVLYYDYELHWFNPGNPWYSQNNPIVSPFTDGVVMFYWGSWTKTAPVVANFTSLLDQAATFSHVPFYTGFYPISYESTLDESSRFSSVSDTQAMLAAAASKSAGVAVYYIPLWINDIARFTSPQSLATVFKQAVNDDPTFDYRFNLIFWAETSMGWYKGITQTITAPATVSSANISFNIKDTIASGTTGIHFKQLLVNGQVVWEADAASDGNGSTVITKNIAPYLTAGQPATLAIRVYDRRNTSFYPVDVYVGNIAISINGSPVANNWSLKSGIDDAVLQNYKNTFSAISSSFAVMKASCAPASCSALGYTCGSASDGCGGILSCGNCSVGFVCTSNHCAAQCLSRDYQQCYNNDLYWYDSCNVRETLAQDCDSDSLTGDYRCAADWTQRESIKKGCSTGSCYSTSQWENVVNCALSGKVCSNGVCIVQTPNLPTVDLRISGVDGPADVSVGASATLSWVSANTTGCTASGAWSGAKLNSGSESTGVLNESQNYTLSCTGSGGSANDSVTANVPKKTLSVDLSVSPASGAVPLNNVSLAATVSGTAQGTINYTFYCDRADTLTTITSDYAAKYDNQSVASKTAFGICNYSSAGRHTAKVVVERDGFQAEGRAGVVIGAASSGGGRGAGGEVAAITIADTSTGSSSATSTALSGISSTSGLTREQILIMIEKIKKMLIQLISQLITELQKQLPQTAGPVAASAHSRIRVGKNLYLGMINDPQVKFQQKVLRA